MTRIKFGFILPIHQVDQSRRSAYVDDLNRSLNLVGGHFDSAWVIDHLQNGAAALLESFTTLAYTAALHPRLKFGHTVVCQSFRNPALLAKMGATLQLLTGGRFLLGIGAGWDEEEYKAYGYAFPSAPERVEQLDETLQIIRAMWTETRATFNGRHYRIAEAYCEPKPDPLPPIMIGAFRPRMLKLAAKYADEWNVSSIGLARYRRLVERFERACADVKRDPAAVRRSWGGGCFCAPTQVEVERWLSEHSSANDAEDDFDFVGTPEQVIGHMRPFIELGVTTFMMDCGGFPELTTLELLINEVLPALNA